MNYFYEKKILLEHKFIIAIGSSAGGLKPMLSFFDNTPNDHASYIILCHLPPNYKSELGAILKHHSKLKVCEVKNGTLIEQNKIYYQPSNMYLTINSDRLYLQSRTVESLYPNLSVDIFLASLAEEKGNESIAIILSGNGSDGSKGAVAIKNNGGLVIVQTPQSCEYSSMPLSAIETGSVDYELLPAEMPATILHHINKWLTKSNEHLTEG